MDEFLELGVADEVEIVLAPLRAPVGMIESGALDFGIVVSEVNNELIGAGRKKLQHFLVGIEPLGLRNAGANFDDGVEDDGVGIELDSVEVGVARKKNRKLVGTRSVEIDLEEIARADDGAHVRVKVRNVDAGGRGFIDLGVDLGFDVGSFGVSDDVRCKERQIAIGVEKTGVFGLRGNGRPTVAGPIGVESEVDAEVGVGMGLGPLSDFGEPGTRNHDAGGSDPVIFEGFLDGGVDGVHHAVIVGVDDEEARVGRIAEALGERV